MSRNYPRLDIETFGEHLLRTDDLDPIYTALQRLTESNAWGHHMSQDQLRRWLVAYWCFYSAGSACYISEADGREFWHMMAVAAENVIGPTIPGDSVRWPRGHERRHFRGDAAVKAVAALRERYGNRPEDMVDYCFETDTPHDRLSCATVSARVKEHTLFGPWIAFKVADMGERVLGRAVDFGDAEVFMFKDPVEAALRLWRERMKLPENARPKDQAAVLKQVVGHLQKHFGEWNVRAGSGVRTIGLQEVETILCKWKSHMNGHYPLWNDTHEIRGALPPWASSCQTAEAFLKAMPRVTADAH